MINYCALPEFEKDFKRLEKRYKTLSTDFEIMKKAGIEALYIHQVDNRSIVKIEGFCSKNYTSNKIRKFTCMSLKGKGSASGIRVIFVWEKHLQKVTFVEIYFKGDKENEDRARLQSFIDKLEQATE